MYPLLLAGMVVRVTYDSDAGTLTFGLHNNPGSTSAGAASITSWGLAFKDLKAVGVVYPAMCLYHRHDEFSIKRVPAAQVCV